MPKLRHSSREVWRSEEFQAFCKKFDIETEGVKDLAIVLRMQGFMEIARYGNAVVNVTVSESQFLFPVRYEKVCSKKECSCTVTSDNGPIDDNFCSHCGSRLLEKEIKT